MLKYTPLLRKYLSLCNYSIRIRFITLTLKNQIRYDPSEIRRYFTLLRRRFGKSVMLSGLYALETTNSGHGWNTHIHAVIVSTYITKQSLMSNWLDISGSWKVDIQEARSIYGLKSYLLGYVTKKIEFSKKEYADEFLESSKHQKLIQTFGSCYNFFVGGYKMVCPDCCGTDWITEYDLLDSSSTSQGSGFAHQKCQVINLSTACAVDFQNNLTNWS